MVSYYYLISSLPSLRADSPMPFSYGEFLKMCENAVSSSDYKRLSELTLASDDGTFLRQWGDFYNRMMRSLCAKRKSRLGKENSISEERDSEIDKTVEEAMSAENPLEAEKILLSSQFAYLDNLVGLHSFDNYVLYGYAIKLKLLERYGVFEQAAGKEEFEGLFNAIQQQISGI